MKRLAILLCGLTSLLSAGPTIIVRGPVFIPSAGPSWYFLETFNASGYDNASSWTETVTGTGEIDEDYTGVLLPDGTHTLRTRTTAAHQANVYATLAADQATIYVYFQIRPITLNNTGVPFFAIHDSGGATIYSCEWQAGDVVRMRCGSVNQTTVGALSASTTYHCWARYTKGTGSNAVASFGFSTTTTEPTSGNNYVSLSNGTSTADARRVWFGRTGNGVYELLFDRVIVNLTTIGDAP